jgi:uncharacterized peroxidase-related enzyme
MARFTQIDPTSSTGKANELLMAVKASMGMVPNMTRGMANSPAVLGGYLGLAGALAGGSLDAKLREKLALVIAESNGCDYCLSAHTAIGGMVKLTSDEILLNRQGLSSDPKDQAALKFALAVLRSRGHVDDLDVISIQNAGFTEGEIGEIVAHIALNVFTNFFNSVSLTDIDFPIAPKLVA